MPKMSTALEIVFWLCACLILWTEVGYGLALWLLDKALRPPRGGGGRDLSAAESRAESRGARRGGARPLPSVSLIIAAHDEAAVIGEKVANALRLDYPRHLFEVIVACDGCKDRTAEKAREAGADVVLELKRGGKIRAQDAAVRRSISEIVAFSDANALWEQDALRTLISAFEQTDVSYACGTVRFMQASSGSEATNQEGLYWRYEMAIRSLESRLRSITAGNGAIYATRRPDYMIVDPTMGHDLSFPFKIVKKGKRAVYVEGAIATEKMVPSIEGELRRKRRMMAHTWAIVLRGGMLSPKGYGLSYAAMMISHRLLRYLTPFLHLIAFSANVAILAVSFSPLYAATLGAQVAILICALLGGALRMRLTLLCRYYVLTTASLALGLWDWLREGVSASWEAAEGTR